MLFFICDHVYTLNFLNVMLIVWFYSQVKEAMQRIHDRGNVGKLILDVEKSPTPLVTTTILISFFLLTCWNEVIKSFIGSTVKLEGLKASLPNKDFSQLMLQNFTYFTSYALDNNLNLAVYMPHCNKLLKLLRTGSVGFNIDLIWYPD